MLDSHEWGVEKPDPRLFKLALEQRAPQRRARCTSATCITSTWSGARQAGLREGVLFDMAGLYDGVDCPRVDSLAALVDRQPEREPDPEARALTFFDVTRSAARWLRTMPRTAAMPRPRPVSLVE